MPNETALRVVLFGATGTVGAGVLLECLDSPAIAEVLCVGRRATGRQHPKLREVQHADFEDFSAIADELSELDACFWCIGIPSSGLSEAQYTKITHDYTVAAAQVLRERSPKLRFVFVSGSGADESETGRAMWGRVKGRTENAVLGMGFASALIFRPAMIRPRRGLKHNVGLYRVATALSLPLLPIARLFGGATSTTEIGRAMIAAALGRSIGDPPKLRLDSGDINALAKLAPEPAGSP